MQAKIKQIGTALMGAVMTGATLFSGALAADISDFQKMGPSDTIVVVGDVAAASDVVGAVNVGASLYAHGVTSAATGGSGTTTVEGGVSLASSSTPIHNGDNINVAKTILSKTEFPTTFADSVVKTNSSTEKKITNQRIEIGSKAISFAKDIDSVDPDYYVTTIGTSATSPLYTLSATFETVNMLSTVGKKLTLFGKEFTVSDKTTSSELVLYTSSTSISLKRGESSKVTIDGVEHTIELRAVAAGSTSSTDRVTVAVDGVSDDVTEGTSTKINGIEIFADKVSSYQEVVSGVALNSGEATLMIGSQQVKLRDANSVMLGSSDDPVLGTKVTFTGSLTALTGVSIAVAAESTDKDYIKQGGSFVDPVFGTFKITFGGVSYPKDSENRDKVTVATSGTKDATVTFNDKLSGTHKTLTFVHSDSPSTSGHADVKKLQYDANKDIMKFEGQNLTVNDYFVAYSDESSRLLYITQIVEKGLSSDRVTIKDVITGQGVYDADSGTSATGNTFTIGSKIYTVRVVDNTTEGSEVVTIAPSTVTATGGDVSGTAVGVYNPIILKNDEQLVLYAPITSGLNATSIVLPDGTKSGTTVAASDIAQDGGWAFKNAGPLRYNIYTANYTESGTYRIQQIYLANSTGVGNLTTAAAIVIENDNDMDSNDRTTNQEAHVTYIDGGVDTSKVGIKGYYYSRQNATTETKQGAYDTKDLESNSDKDQASNAYGTLITYTSTGQGSVEISYPPVQMTANVYVLTAAAATPTGGATGGASTTFPSLGVGISKTDTEIGADKTTKNLILVGGPAPNKLVAELATQGKTPTMDEWFANLQGKAIIQVIDDAFLGGKKAIVVAGFSKEDTRTATLKLATEYGTNTATSTFKGKAKQAIGGVWSDFVYPFPATTPATVPENTTGNSTQ